MAASLGLDGVGLIVEDRCPGMPEAVGEVCPDSNYQRCAVHLHRNAFSAAPRSKVELAARMLRYCRPLSSGNCKPNLRNMLDTAETGWGNGGMYYVYLLRCGDGSLYTGITTDPERRLAEHQGQGGRGAKYTAARRAVRMEAAWTAADRSAASRLERRIKRLTKGEKEALITGQLPERPEFEAYQKQPISPDGNLQLFKPCAIDIRKNRG